MRLEEAAEKRRERLHHGWSRLFMSVRGRATVLTVAVSAVMLVLALSLGTLLARDWAENTVAENTERTAERVVVDLVEERNGGALVPADGEAPMVQVVSRDGRRVLAASEAIDGEPPLIGVARLGRSILIDGEVCPRSLDDCVWVFGLRMRTSPYGDGVFVLAGSPMPTLANAWLLPLAMALLLVALLALIGWWTWHTVGRALEPVDRISDELADITERGLGRRVPNPHTHGEIQRLAETVNATLERLEDARSRERRFISDASHDLRNPIAGLHTRLEVALDEPGDEHWRPMVRSALRDTERLNDVVVDLLELSRLDSRAPLPVQEVDLADLARREVDRRPDPERITTRLEPGVVVRANPVRMSRVLGNLLSNAERHAESRIEVTVARDGERARLEVADDGAGVPPESRERVFERFARLSESRRRDPQGTGLGLPIAREIAEIYGGTLRLADTPGGARFVMSLPLAETVDDRGGSAEGLGE
ncbi:sensor histidine kinase [Actinomadura fibrosa]|uniref:histidine kinase n=1 Tax=Actinomadura fibrosa TaxID=111802 RepID=A0ABW2XFN6_9ACTN|nr:HAMP domain-containing sensor histidine kinase [Actinomadura fibrosa]